MPRSTAESTRNVPNAFAAPAASVAAAPITTRAPVACSRPLLPRDRFSASCSAGTSAIAAAASTAASTNAQRQPTVSATAGTAAPASSVLTGIAACFTPNDRPCRRAGTCRARLVLLASCPAALAPAPSARIAIRLHSDRAATAMASSDAEARPIPHRETIVEPYRSTIAPAGTDASALAPKYAETARPSPAGEKSSS
jgi:hypothetical protein